MISKKAMTVIVVIEDLKGSVVFTYSWSSNITGVKLWFYTCSSSHNTYRCTLARLLWPTDHGLQGSNDGDNHDRRSKGASVFQGGESLGLVVCNWMVMLATTYLAHRSIQLSHLACPTKWKLSFSIISLPRSLASTWFQVDKISRIYPIDE